MTQLQIALDCVGTEAEVEQIAAAAAASCPGINYKVVQDEKAQWPTIVATSFDHGELLSFGELVYINEAPEGFAYLISTVD